MSNYDLLKSARPLTRRLNAGTALTYTQILMIAKDQQRIVIDRVSLNNVTNFAMSTVAGHLRELKRLGYIDADSYQIRITSSI